jgi:hypothetical protein
MKHRTVILPVRFPCLTDKAAAQLVELLQELFKDIEHHYAKQVHRYHKRQREIQAHQLSPPASYNHPLF